MIEKLELKHIAQYLPYMLTAITQNRTVEIDGIDYGKELPIIWHAIKSDMTGRCGLRLRPILRPLSDIGDVPGKYLSEESNLDIGDQITLSELSNRKMNFRTLEYHLAVHLFENHFDCFGLIGSGLAVDINTLK